MSIDKVIISGGGTGGHIFPALAIANEIKRRNPNAEILFVGALGRMEMEKIPAEGYEIIGLPVIGFPRKPGVKMVTFFLKLRKSAKMARKIVRTFHPQIAIGVGGYASGPLLRAAATQNIPTLIQEQNSYAGITNKLLGRRVNTICVAYDNMERFFPKRKIVFTGNPVRANLTEQLTNNKEARTFLGLKEKDKVILVVGGSLGARSFNMAVEKNLDAIADSGVHLIWQTGAFYYDSIIDKLRDKKPANIQIHKFLSRMDMAYAAADLVVSRAGAGTISELCMVGKPAILVPSPNVAEDHQTKNALALVNKKAALMLNDYEIGDKLFPLAFDIIANKQKCSELANTILTLAKPDATAAIVDEAEKLVNR
ncbi:MAG: undecaprenyldiphospho-muramoylpentapeptide beta-N-acetylglucosaminyltransferase [Draconibacterium sp.]|nr:MAG: undecaprenyldiphospho-muramoylpentapeptide beta-N-acetylglucosaminyltransferase [Draconibacterium sp.]